MKIFATNCSGKDTKKGDTFGMPPNFYNTLIKSKTRLLASHTREKSRST